MKFIHTFSHIFLAALIFIGSAALGFAQSKMGTIAVLPFNGGTADERDGIAEWFGMIPQMMQNFDVIPRTTITKAIGMEQSFQLSGMTDADTMARLGNQIGANYVLAGSITKVGSANLLIVSIVRIDVIQQVAGDFIIYNSLDELSKDRRAAIRKMSDNLVSMMKKDSAHLDKLAVLPVQFSDGSFEQEGDALAQLLSIYLIRSGKYAVYPRTKSLDQVQSEYKTQMSGITSDAEAVALGRGVNPQYVLSIASRKIGSGSSFNALVINLERGNQIAGVSEEYANLTDGINAMDYLARELSGVQVTDTERRKRSSSVGNSVASAERAQAAEERAQKRQEANDEFLRNSGVAFSGWIGFSLLSGSEYAEGEEPDGPPTGLIGGGGGIELRLSRYFGVLAGIEFFPRNIHITDNTSFAENVTISTLQVPVLVKGHIFFDNLMFFSPYVGIGLNVWSEADNKVEILSVPPTSLIVGLEMNVLYTFFGLQYNRDFSESIYSFNGKDFPFGRDAFIIYVGFAYFSPFRK